METKSLVLWPLGKATVIDALLAELASGITAPNTKNHLHTPTLAANATLNMVVDGQQREGDELVVFCKTAATETLTFGSNIDAPVLVGVAGKTKAQAFEFSKGVWKAKGAPVQID